MAPKLFGFFLHNLKQIFSKIDWPDGVATVIFQTRGHEISDIKFFLLFKMAEIRREHNFRSEKSFFDNKKK